MALHLLNDSDSEVSECEVKDEQTIVRDFLEKLKGPKTEADC